MQREILVAASVVAASVLIGLATTAQACTRCVYLGPNDNVMVARSMDWVEDPGSEVWVFPRGMQRNGAAGPGSLEWSSRYGSAVFSFYGIACWTQYVLDSFATVNEAVTALEKEPFTVVAPILPNGEPGVGHMSISDPTGDSAVLEYVKGKLVIHHGRQFQVMTNSPTFDQQLALNAYCQEIGGPARSGARCMTTRTA